MVCLPLSQDQLVVFNTFSNLQLIYSRTCASAKVLLLLGPGQLLLTGDVVRTWLAKSKGCEARRRFLDSICCTICRDAAV